MPTVKQLSRIFSVDDSLNRLQDQLAAALNPILRNVQGDLSGPLESPSVIGLQGRSLSAVAPSTGQAIVWNGTQWAPGTVTGLVTGVLPPLTVTGGVLSIPQANATTDGYLSATDWVSFNGKVSSVTATSPLASSGGSTPDISLTGVVAAANGGTGLSSPGTIGNVLTSTGTGWTSAVATASPSGPAGGVLGYAGSAYPNPNGLAGINADPSYAYIPIRQGSYLGGARPVKFKYDTFSQSTAGGRELWIEGADAFSFPNPLAGGALYLRGGKGNTQPAVNNGAGGAAHLLGGDGVNAVGGQAIVQGGYATGAAGGDTYIRGGAPDGGQNGGDVYVIGGQNFLQNAIGGDVTIRGGNGTTDGSVIIGDQTTTAITIGALSSPPSLSWQGQPIDITSVLPTTNDTLTYNGTAWIPQAQQSFPAVFISLSDNTAATAIPSGTALMATYDTVEDSNGITLVSNSEITVPYDGVYEFFFSPQLELTTGSSDDITIWVMKNGANVARSASRVQLGNNNSFLYPAISFIIRLDANDYIEWALTASATNAQISTITAATPYPQIPGIIASAKFLGA